MIPKSYGRLLDGMTIANNFHQEILLEIKKQAGNGTSHSWSDSYLGTGHYYYSLSVPNKRLIAKTWAKNHQDIKLSEFIDLLDSLYRGESYEEKTTASELLEYLPTLRNQLHPKKLNEWLSSLQGWAEIDSLCQGIFTFLEMDERWSEWSNLIKQFSKDTNTSKRRAGLVLLTGPVVSSDDEKFSQLAFEIIDTLKFERDILITKAISWLLRSLVKNHKTEVVEYLEANKNSLPKIAIREAKRKILTGKK